MTPVQTFWRYLYLLIHTSGTFQAWVVQNGHPHIIYGGTAIQAFLIALHTGCFWGPLH